MAPPAFECPPGLALVRWIEAVFESMGGRVRLDPEGDNLCRRARLDESGPDFVVEAQGLPNLVHELVHALFLGRLEDDHGFDYGLIPLDLAQSDHRRHLWEELTACVVSVAYGESRFRQAWFIEQFEIQGVFHGLEHDLDGFRDRVDQAVSRPDWRTELEDALSFGFREVRDQLLAAGAPVELAGLNDVLQFESIWQEYRQSWSVSGARRN